ncbi:MAG: NUDIX domain-containing protein [Oscillospiraceae bacterium]
MRIRSCVKALVLHEGKLLLNDCRNDYFGDHFSLPGGGQDLYETMEEAIVRECLEETGYHVEPLRLAAVCGEIQDDPVYREQHAGYSHKNYHVFLCRLVSETPEIPSEPDAGQVSSQWVPVEKLHEARIMPLLVGENIDAILNAEHPLYLGTKHEGPAQ